MTLIDSSLQKFSQCCLTHHLSVAVAESVTSGYLQWVMSTMPEAISVFNGGITAYNIGQKVKQLQVDYMEGARSNCVSKQVAAQMAKGVANLFSSRLGIAITGYASPVPELNIKERYAYVALWLDDEIVLTTRIKSNASKDPVDVQQHFGIQVIEITVKFLEQKLT